jgi:hypothetical protein
MSTEVTEAHKEPKVDEAPLVILDDNSGIKEENASQEDNQGTISRSESLNNSVHSSDNIQSDSMNAELSGSEAPNSSRASTKISGTIEDILYPEDENYVYNHSFYRDSEPNEPETNEDGSKNLT